MKTIDIFVVTFVASFYVGIICIPPEFYSNLVKKLNRNKQGSDCNNEPNKIARQLSNETFFLKNHLRRVSQCSTNGDIKKILDSIIPDVIPNKKQKNGEQY